MHAGLAPLPPKLPFANTLQPERVPEIQAAMVKCSGHLGATAKLCKLSRTALCIWIKQSPELMETIHDIREEQADTVYLKLTQLAMNGNTTAIDRYLKSKIGRERGFGEHIEVEHTGNIALTDDRFNEIVQTMPVDQLRVLADLQDKLDGYRPPPPKHVLEVIAHATRLEDGNDG